MTDPAIASEATLVRAPLERLIRSTRRALETGQIIRIGNEEDPIVLCHRRTGSTISDDECASDFEALSSGIYKRYRRVTYDRGVEVSADLVWMYLCPLQDDVMVQVIGHQFDALAPIDREGIAIQTCMIAIAQEEATLRARKRQLRLQNG